MICLTIDLNKTFFHRQPQEEQDTDYRLQTQTSWSDVSNNGSRRESAEEVSIPVELSMEHHAEILIQAHKHLQEGKLTHEQHQLLLQQLGELMKIQKLQEETRKIQQLQEASRRLSLEAERIKQESQASMGEDIMNMSPIKPEVPLDRDLRQPLPVTPENAQRIPPNIDSTPPGPHVNRRQGDFGPPAGQIPDDGRDRLQGTAIRDQSRPDVRENQQGGIAPQDMPPMQPPPRPFFVKDGEPFEGPKRDIGPFDRGDHNRNDFGPADRRGMGPPPSEMSPSGRFGNIPGEVQDFDGRRGLEDGMGSNQQRLHGQPDMSNIGPQSSDHGDGRDFDGRPGPMDRMGSGQTMPYGPQNVQDNEPLRQDFGPHHENDIVPPFDRACEPTVDRGFPENRPGPKDRRDFGPPNRFADGPQGEMEMGPPNRFDEGHQGGERQDRMDMQGDRRDFDFHGRRDGPPGERDYGPPDRMHRGPPGKMGHGPPDRDFDRRDEPPGGRGRGRGFGPPGRMDMENNRVPGRRDPDWREPGPLGMGPQDRNAGPQGISHTDRDRIDGGRIDRNYGPPGMGHRGGPPGMDHQDKDQWHHPDGDRNHSGRGRDDGPEVMGYPDRNQGPPGRRGLEWGDHGPPGRHGPGGPDFRPDRPHGDGDFGPGGRRDGFSDRRDVGPERRDDNSRDRQDGHPGRFQDGPPGRFQDGRNFQHEDRMGPHRFDERRSPEKFRHDRRDERPGQQGRFDGPSDGRNWGQNEGREFGPAGRGHGPPGFREHGPMDRMPHGRDQRPMDRIGPENNREGTPDWNERRPGWRGERNSDRRNEPGRWADQPDWRDGPNDRKDVPHDRDERRAGPPGRDTRDEKSHEEKRPEWPLGDIQHPFNPCRAELENIEKMVSERKTPPIDEVIQQDSEETIPLKVDQEPETRKTSVEQDAKPDKVTRNQKEQEQTDNVENTGQKVGLLPTPPAHFKVEPLSDHEDEDQRKSEAFVKKDTKHIPALLAMPTIKPTKELSVEQIKELPEGDMETDEDKDPKTGLGKWKTSKVEPKKKSSKKTAKKVEKKDDDSDDDAEERQHNPFAVGSFLKEMLPPSKDKPTKKIEKKKPEKEQKETVKEEKPEKTNTDNEMKQLGKNEKTQDRNEKKLPVRDEKRRDRGRDKKDKLHENEMRPHGRDEMGPPGRDKMRPHGRDGNRPHVRDDMRPPGMEGMRPPGPWEGPPRHPDGRHMGPRPRGPMPHGQMMDGPRGPMMDRPRGPMMDRPRGPLMDGPRGPMMDGPHGPHPQGMNTSPRKNQDEDPRWTSYSDMGPEVSEEVVIGNKNYAIKLGDRPRVVKFSNESIEVYADAAKRGIVIDGNLMYKFGERVKEVELRGRTVRMFYHGKPVNLWIDGQNYEIRVDAPPRNIEINGNNHKIQIDGRDMMILIDKVEKGPYGGPPRFIFIDEDRMEIRFDPPPRHILIDGKLCELMLALKRPCVNIEGKLHGIRFDGPPREVVINNQVFMIHTDRAVKVRVDNKLHYICLGGPCHELIIDGKWYEMKFSEPPKEINVGNRILSVHLPGNPPEVKILPEISPMPGPIGMPMGPGMMGPGPMRPMGPGMEPMMRGPVPMGPGQGPMGPIPQNERLPFPMAPRPEVSQAGAFPLNRPPMSAAQPMVPTFPGPDSQPRPSLPQPPVSMGRLYLIHIVNFCFGPPPIGA